MLIVIFVFEKSRVYMMNWIDAIISESGQKTHMQKKFIIL